MNPTMTPLLSQLSRALAGHEVRIVDLTHTLSPDFPALELPPQFGQVRGFSMERISNYDEAGPGWYWNNFSCGEHTGTHFDAPSHWVSGRDREEGTVDTIKPGKLHRAGGGRGCQSAGGRRRRLASDTGVPAGLGGRARPYSPRGLGAAAHRLVEEDHRPRRFREHAGRWCPYARPDASGRRVAGGRARRSWPRSGDVIGTEEFFHPRLPEICGILPRRLGAWIERSPRVSGWLGRRVDRSRRIYSASITGYVQLRAIAGLRRWRRASLRHAQETRHLETRLVHIFATAPHDCALALALVRCRRVVKGYSDTHACGQGRFDRLMAASGLLRGRTDAGAQLQVMLQAAMADASGGALERCWKEIGLPAVLTA